MTSDTSLDIGGKNSSLSRRRRRQQQLNEFTFYLSFNAVTTICICIFLLLYIIVLLIVSPLLRPQQQQPSSYHGELGNGEILRPVLDNLKNVAETEKAYLEKLKQDGYINTIKKQLYQFRQRKGISDQSLIDAVNAKLKNNDNNNKNNNGTDNNRRQKEQQPQNQNPVVVDTKKQRNGFIVLGMHRSGTSMLSGLLVNGLGYHVGGPLIGSAFDNEKGFFELLSVVLQNDEFMNKQRVWWSSNVLNYHDDIALQHKKNGKIKFDHGKQALSFLNNPSNVPYIQKDPRMCITLKTWLPLLNHEPAVVFTYRHPLEVAHSLMKREQGMMLAHGLRLWIVYNMRAIQNMKGLCIVYSSNDAVVADAYHEVQRISEELTSKCHVPKPSQSLTQAVVDKFVDPTLQHNKQQHHNNNSKGEDNHNMNDQRKIIAKFDNEECLVYEFETTSEIGSRTYEIEETIYLKAMEICCHLKSGKAYQDDYNWPDHDWFVSVSQ